MRGGSVNYGGMDDGYVPDYHTGRRISATQYQQQQYEQVSMTQLLTHTVAHSTRPSFRHKTNNQPTKKFLHLAVT